MTRHPDAGRWLSARPVATVAAVLVAGGVSVGAFETVAAWRWSPLQRHYLRTYGIATGAARVGLAVPLTVWYVDDRPATDADLTATVVLTPRRERYDPAVLQAWFQAAIYHGRTFADVLAVVWWAGLLTLAGGLVVAVPADLRRARARRAGRRLRGSELVSAAEFSRRVGGDGLALPQVSGQPVRLPRTLETSHLSICGATGTGKSTIIQALLDQIAGRGETAVVYDPAMEYVPHFFTPSRGDVILNPGDARCPYWNIGAEVLDHMEALAIATALFPVKPGNDPNRFFQDAARAIFAYLLEKSPTTETMTSWILHEAELDRQLVGSPHVASVDHRAPQQRAAVLSDLTSVASSLQLCPPPKAQTWTAAAWEPDRRGWVFLTSSPNTRDRLRPLHSLWLDTIILRCMGGAVERRKTWLIVDEIATLNRLPQLHTALTEGRKSNLAVVIGFQGKGQLETRYGLGDTDTMLAQPAMKIILRVAAAEAAKWASDLLGQEERERLNPSRQDGWARTKTSSHTLARHIDPLLLPSELSGLENLTGYLKIGGLVTPLRFPYTTRPTMAPAFEPRGVTVGPRPVLPFAHR